MRYIAIDLFHLYLVLVKFLRELFINVCTTITWLMSYSINISQVFSRVTVQFFNRSNCMIMLVKI